MTSAMIAARLPSPVELERLSISIAALDAVLSPEWQYRYFSFDPMWDGEQRLASMRNGCGDEYQIVFSEPGTAVRCFWHESPLSPWIRDDGSLAPGCPRRPPTGTAVRHRRAGVPDRGWCPRRT